MDLEPLHFDDQEPLPAADVRFVDLHVEPWPDGRRVRVHVTLTPFQERPNLLITVFAPSGEEVCSANIIESMEDRFVFTLHLRGEPVDAVSREVGVPIYKLEQCRDRALAGIDAGLKERENDPLAKQLDEANRRIGELVMEVEILQKERRAKRPLVGRRSSR